ncbi:MAG: hypothetical protein JW849_11560 [Phycisphaerae bacterium]|nr:hypothetical protein [Phycisphaerae bacterium]
MARKNCTNRGPSRYGAWATGLLLGGLGGAVPWMYVGVWNVSLLAGAVSGAVAGLAAGMLWARRMLLILNDEDASRAERIAAGVGWGAISAAGAILLYWGALTVLYRPAADMFLQAGYFAVLVAIAIGGTLGLLAGLCWIHAAARSARKE